MSEQNIIHEILYRAQELSQAYIYVCIRAYLALCSYGTLGNGRSFERATEIMIS